MTRDGLFKLIFFIFLMNLVNSELLKNIKNMQNIIDTHNIDNRNTINFFKNLTNFNNEINNLIFKKVYYKKFNFNNGWDADIPLEYFTVYDVENVNY